MYRDRMPMSSGRAPGSADDAIPPDLVPAIGYIRVSMWHEEAISPELQKTAISEWAHRRGRRIIDWIEELDQTGRNFRRKIMAAITRVEAGEAREIAVWKYSRFGRDRAGCQLNLARIETAGGQLQSATEEIDAQTAIGKFTRGMLMEVAAFESDRAGEQWAEAREHRKAAGLHGAGRAKFGYVRLGRIPDPDRPGRTRRDLSDPAGERYVPDAATGPVLREMYLDYTAGGKHDTIAQRLNATGITNAYGRRWSWDTVRDVLDSGFGAGLLRVHAKACQCGKATRCRRKDFLPGAHEAVITQAEWQAYTARRALVAATPPRVRAASWRLTGLLRCGHCGSKMSVLKPGGRNRVPRLRCSRWTRFHDCPGGGRKIPYPVALGAVGDWLDTEGITLAGAGRTVLVAAAADAAKAERELASQIAGVDRRLTHLVTTKMLDTEMPEEVWAASRASLLAERAQIAADLTAVRRRAAVNTASVTAAITSLAEGWDVLPAPRIREMLAALIHYVVVWRADEDGVKVHRARVFPAWEPEWAGPGSEGIPG